MTTRRAQHQQDLEQLLKICEQFFSHAGPATSHDLDTLLRAYGIYGGTGWLWRDGHFRLLVSLTSREAVHLITVDRNPMPYVAQPCGPPSSSRNRATGGRWILRPR